MAPIAKTAQEKFDELMSKGIRLANGCLICHLAPNAKGYSPLTLGGRLAKKQRAHRFVFEHINGPLPASVLVLHNCDNRRCIEPVHLYAGTPSSNTDDMMRRLRGANQYKSGYSRRGDGDYVE